MKKLDIKITLRKSFTEFLKRNQKVELGEENKNISSPKVKK